MNAKCEMEDECEVEDECEIRNANCRMRKINY